MSKYAVNANRMVLFMLTLGLTAIWTAHQHLEYQDRLVRYSYLDTLISLTRLLDAAPDFQPVNRVELCQKTEQDFTTCFQPGLQELNADTTIITADPSRPAYIKNNNVKGVESLQHLRPQAQLDEDLSVLIVPIPFKDDASAQDLCSFLLGGEDLSKVTEAFYVEFSGGEGWPAVLIKVGAAASDWQIVQSDWANLWFIGGKHGFRQQQNLPWIKQFPASMRVRLNDFTSTYYTVLYSDIERRAIRDAARVSGQGKAPATFDEAMTAVRTKPRTDITLPGLPDAAEVVITIVPFVFAYSALILMSSVRSFTLSQEGDDEPWLFLNGRSALEMMLGMSACMLVFASGLCILYLILVTDAQASVRFADGMRKLTGEQYYQLLGSWLRHTYDSSRDSGTPYLQRIPAYAISAIFSTFIGIAAIAVASGYLFIWYAKHNSTFALVKERSRVILSPVVLPINYTATRVPWSSLARRFKSALFSVVKNQVLWMIVSILYILGSLIGICLIIAQAFGLQTERVGIPIFSVMAVLSRVALAPFEIIALCSLSFKIMKPRKPWWYFVFIIASLIYVCELYSIFASEEMRSLIFIMSVGLDKYSPVGLIDKILAGAIFFVWGSLAVYIFGSHAVSPANVSTSLPRNREMTDRT